MNSNILIIALLRVWSTTPFSGVVDQTLPNLDIVATPIGVVIPWNA